MKDQHFSSDDEVDLEPDDKPVAGKVSHLISVHELRAAGALDVPAAWRKSLGTEPSKQFTLFGEDDMQAGEHDSASSEADDDESFEENENV